LKLISRQEYGLNEDGARCPFQWTFAIRRGIVFPGGCEYSRINGNYFDKYLIKMVRYGNTKLSRDVRKLS